MRADNNNNNEIVIGTQTDPAKRNDSLSALCAMFSEFESEDYLEQFYAQLLEIEGIRPTLKPNSNF